MYGHIPGESPEENLTNTDTRISEENNGTKMQNAPTGHRGKPLRLSR